MIILHPTNNLITRILIGKKQVELLNPQVPPSKSHRILCGSTSRPPNKEYINARRFREAEEPHVSKNQFNPIFKIKMCNTVIAQPPSQFQVTFMMKNRKKW